MVGDPGLGKSQVCYLFTGIMDMEMIVVTVIIIMIKDLHIFLSKILYFCKDHIQQKLFILVLMKFVKPPPPKIKKKSFIYSNENRY